jgi:hypothetical protein
MMTYPNSPAKDAADAERARRAEYDRLSRVQAMPEFRPYEPRIGGRVVIAWDESRVVFRGE